MCASPSKTHKRIDKTDTLQHTPANPGSYQPSHVFTGIISVAKTAVPFPQNQIWFTSKKQRIGSIIIRRRSNVLYHGSFYPGRIPFQAKPPSKVTAVTAPLPSEHDTAVASPKIPCRLIANGLNAATVNRVSINFRPIESQCLQGIAMMESVIKNVLHNLLLKLVWFLKIGSLGKVCVCQAL